MSYFAVNQSVSHGTMRNEDLLSSFASALDGACEQEGAKSPLHNKLIEQANALVEMYGEDADSVDEEEASDLVNELFDALNWYAPEGTTFGAHEGDGSDYGFWQYDDTNEADEARVYLDGDA